MLKWTQFNMGGNLSKNAIASQFDSGRISQYKEKAEVDYLDYPSVSLCFLPPSRLFNGNRTWTIKNSSLELGFQ